MLSLAMAAALLAQPETRAQPRCDPVPGAEALWADSSTRFVIVGELHGTTETPAVFADLVCLSSRDRPVAVGVEAGSDFVAVLNTYLDSDGGPDARAAFLRHLFWTQPFKDGRSSQATLALFDELRLLRGAGRQVSVLGWQPDAWPPKGFYQSYLELEMAQLLSKGAQSNPQARVLVLAGSFHAGKKPIEAWGGVLPAAGHLSPKVTLTLLAASAGGTAWNCPGSIAAECGPTPTGGENAGGVRGVVLSPQWGGAFDGMLGVGPVTASPPAVR